MKSFLNRLFLTGFAIAFLAGSAWAQTQAGTIKALRITGTVTKVAADGTSSRLADGAILTENDTVVTDTNSGVVLVFMNGSSVRLGAGSRLAIEQFKMDPLTEDIAVAKLTNEPTVSQTTLNLTYGELVGDVKKLNTSSSYSIKTPAGAAGIRGTQFRIVFTPTPDGRSFNFTLSTSDGVVVFSGTTGAAGLEVAQGSEVVVRADVDTNTGAVSNVQVQSQGISADATAAITNAVNNVIQQAQADAVFTPEQQRADATPPDTTTTTPTETSTPREEPPPPPDTTTPQPIDPSTVSRSG